MALTEAYRGMARCLGAGGPTTKSTLREAALKVLPDSFANDVDRFARFTREAQTLASPNHPNIAHIHGLEESDGGGVAGRRCGGDRGCGEAAGGAAVIGC
jgi:hypothetical protein